MVRRVVYHLLYRREDTIEKKPQFTEAQLPEFLTIQQKSGLSRKTAIKEAAGESERVPLDRGSEQLLSEKSQGAEVFQVQDMKLGCWKFCVRGRNGGPFRR
jgi:hypothetical protein